MVFRNILLAFGLVGGLAGCGLPAGAPIQSQVLSQANAEDPDFAVVEVTRETVTDIAHWPPTGWGGSYRWLQAGGGGNASVIRPGDRIDLVIWDNQENSLLTTPNAKSTAMAGLEVAADGTIFVPYVGDVVINGLTPDRARAEVQKEVERIAPAAQVQLAAKPGEKNTVDLVRGVARPGPVALPSRNFTILSLISHGGGISQNLRDPLVRLIRGGKTYEIRADDLLADPRRNIVMRGGDKVVVDEDDRYFVASGATGDSVVYFGKEHLTAIEAISMSGGLMETRADPKGLLVLRDYPARAVRKDGVKGPKMQQVVFSFDLTSADGLFAARAFEINPGDLLLATEAPMVGVGEAISLVSSAVGLKNRLGI